MGEREGGGEGSTMRGETRSGLHGEMKDWRGLHLERRQPSREFCRGDRRRTLPGG
jgi:hypothetical protein